MTQKEETLLLQLEETKVISTADKNLRSKIDSIIRSLENLSEKKARIEFEIKRQKKSLTRKRAELKKVSRSNQAKLSLSLESGAVVTDTSPQEETLNLQILDSKLLQESSQQLDD